jgi:hypothetical protein
MPQAVTMAPWIRGMAAYMEKVARFWDKLGHYKMAVRVIR